MAAGNPRLENEEEVDDYMSDSLLIQDIRPGLPLSHESKRKLHQAKIKQECDLKPKKVREEQARQSALSQPISSENKGFKILCKMGFQPDSLSTQKPPININMKCDRTGIGFARQSTSSAKCKLDEKTNDQARFQFVTVTKEKLDTRFGLIDLQKSQRTCRHLDMEAGLTEAPDVYFWPEERVDGDESIEREDDKDGMEDVSLHEQLCKITEYLRGQYFYCLWCGLKYEGTQDLEENCPGNNRSSHDG